MAERSVTRAAEKLGRTQSAVSHALARLREQLGDPLLVKARGGMQPSPFSIELIEQVRPTLRSVQRVLSPKRVFEPATAQRTFRLALPDVAPSLFPRLLARARKQAPAVALDWTSPRENTPRDVAEGHTDLALTPAILRMPDGVAADPVGALQWCCFARRGHPALRRWDLGLGRAGPTSWSVSVTERAIRSAKRPPQRAHSGRLPPACRISPRWLLCWRIRTCSRRCRRSSWSTRHSAST